MRTVLIAVMIAFAPVALAAQPLTGGVHAVAVARGDTLRSLGSRFGVDPATIARDNGRALDAPLRAGEMLSIDNRHIVPALPAGMTLAVNVPQRMLFAVTGSAVTAYPVAVGRRDWPTPLGEFSIATKETNPTWDVPESIREEARRAGRTLPLKVPPGPDNPLGEYWLGLSAGSVGIHGTNAPASVYQVVTHGCIRLQPQDISALFGQVTIGARGVVIYQPVLVAIQGEEVFVEAHRDVYARGPADALEFVRLRMYELGVLDRVDWDRVAAVIRERAGIARPVLKQLLSRARLPLFVAQNGARHLQIRSGYAPVRESHILTGRRHSQELDVDQAVERLTACHRVESPQPLRLMRRDAQPGHLDVLRANPVKEIVDGREVGGVHVSQPVRIRDGNETITPYRHFRYEEFLTLDRCVARAAPGPNVTRAAAS